MAETVTRSSLDEQQLAAVDVVGSARQVVIAGPGSGKTEVVSCLVEHLLGDEQIDPVDGVLVISFSNAAVHAVDSRLRARGLPPVAVQTLDSFAWQLVRDLAVTDPPLDFDGRVTLATALLADQVSDRIDDLVHLVVDEVQDVVGIRADFLLRIIERLPADTGFTLLGDPAQGIYDFQLRPEERSRGARSTTTSTQLFETACGMPAVETKHLTGQYRAVSRDATAASDLRDVVLAGSNGGAAVEDFYAGLVPVGPIDAAAGLVSIRQGTTAFLTATNGQALLVAGALRSHGMPVEVRRSANQRVIAPWPAVLLGDLPTDTVSRAELDERVAARTPDLDHRLLWRALRAVAGEAGTEVSLRKLAERLRAPGYMPSALIAPPASSIVISTVHRAKGLEFDNVVLVDFAAREWFDDSTEPSERLRTRFVALTRARRLILRAEGPEDRSVRRMRDSRLNDERWYLGGREKWMTFGFEIGVRDVEPPAADATTSQRHLATEVCPGDALKLTLDVAASTLRIPVYTLLHRGVEVGRTTRRFGEDLALRIGTLEKKRSGWPALSGATVETVATIARDPLTWSRGRSSFELAPVTTGLLHIDWKGTSHD